MRVLPVAFCLILSFIPALGAELRLDQRPASSSEWGYRPGNETSSATNPPSFVWRPQKDIVAWELECSRSKQPDEVVYRATDIEFNVHCPPSIFMPGDYGWRYRGRDRKGNTTSWSKARRFTIPPSAVEMPLPTRDDLLERIPKTHPRLFIRPEDLPRLRTLAQGALKGRFRKLIKQCDALVAHPPETAEPLKYPPEVVRGDERWREIWWGNRTHTIRALGGAATLAFTRLLGGREEYGQLARRILMDCARWDPKGSTGYRYNDEAGMPYNYYFARTYTFVHDLLTEEERQTCRRVMRIRGEEMYRHLCPRHLWRPYSSHSNRAWHFLGEVGIAFHGEIPEADQWTWFATNVFFNVYPVWSDDDGGWHEGISYWSSYIGRFTWWADCMRSALEIDAYKKPYFSQVGYYPMYLMPPGKEGGGLGDLTARRKSSHLARLMTQLAAQSGNGYWQWYVEQVGGPSEESGYIGFIRGMLPSPEPKSPEKLPTSRLFRGTGQAYLNTTLLDANEDVQVVFKSSPFGTYSHGYEANNSFLLWAYGRRLLIRSGYRDIYGSKHHKNWMWSTRSVNNITVNGQSQKAHSSSAHGEIVAFKTTPSVDMVVGEAGQSHDALQRYTRAILFIKPELIVVFDRLVAKEPSTFDYWLHAVKPFEVKSQKDIRLRVDDVGCRITFLAPRGLTLHQTDQYDPNPRPRITLREWHLTGGTQSKSKTMEFVTLYRPHRVGAKVPEGAELKHLDGGYLLEAELNDGRIIALLPTSEATFSAEGLTAEVHPLIQRLGADGKEIQTMSLEESPRK